MVLDKFTRYNLHPKFSLNAISVIVYILCYYSILMSFWDYMSLGLIVVGINCRDQMSGIKCRGIKYRGIKCHQFVIFA